MSMIPTDQYILSWPGIDEAGYYSWKILLRQPDGFIQIIAKGDAVDHGAAMNDISNAMKDHGFTMSPEDVEKIVDALPQHKAGELPE